MDVRHEKVRALHDCERRHGTSIRSTDRQRLWQVERLERSAELGKGRQGQGAIVVQSVGELTLAIWVTNRLVAAVRVLGLLRRYLERKGLSGSHGRPGDAKQNVLVPDDYARDVVGAVDLEGINGFLLLLCIHCGIVADIGTWGKHRGSASVRLALLGGG